MHLRVSHKAGSEREMPWTADFQFSVHSPMCLNAEVTISLMRGNGTSALGIKILARTVIFVFSACLIQ